MVITDKFKKLRQVFKEIDSAVVAFSGGVDSVFLAQMAKEILGEKILAITIISEFLSQSEKKWAARIAGKLKIKYKTCNLKLPVAVMNNSKERCYYCKKAIFSFLCRFAKENGYSAVLDGSNLDDLKDFRPGKRALEELNIISPLQIAGFTKDEIRLFSRRRGLETWNKPSSSCLATRLPYGEKITPGKLKLIAEAELFLSKLGFNPVRLRLHGSIGRIEVAEEKIPLFCKNSSKVIEKLRSLGVRYICADLVGYRSGSINEVIKWKRKK